MKIYCALVITKKEEKKEGNKKNKFWVWFFFLWRAGMELFTHFLLMRHFVLSVEREAIQASKVMKFSVENEKLWRKPLIVKTFPRKMWKFPSNLVDFCAKYRSRRSMWFSCCIKSRRMFKKKIHGDRKKFFKKKRKKIFFPSHCKKQARKKKKIDFEAMHWVKGRN